MSEEEAIECLKERVKLDRKIRNNKAESDYEQFCENECQAIETILNLADKQQKEIEELHKEINQRIKLKIENEKCVDRDFIYKGKIRERIKHNEEQKNIVESVGKFKINDDGITGEGIEGLNDLIVYKSYEAVINELNYLLEEKYK